MSNKNKTEEWTLPVLDSDPKVSFSTSSEKLSNAAWTSVAIGVVTKKILKDDAREEYPFKQEIE